MTTQAEIGSWFDRGVTQHAAYMVVWCDTYDYDDYPSYYENADKAKAALQKPGSMQRAMECYELDPSKRAEQLAQRRCWALSP